MPVKDNLDNYHRMIMDLKGVGATIDDEDQAVVLLSSLPIKYEPFVDTLMFGRDLRSQPLLNYLLNHQGPTLAFFVVK